MAAARSGSRNVWFPTVKSAVESVAVKELVAVDVCGLIAIESVLAVVDEKVAEFVVVKVEENAPEV